MINFVNKTLVFLLFIFVNGLMIQADEITTQSNSLDEIQIKVEKYQLPNGLTVILHEDHSAPIISVHQWFRVGSADEKPGQTGIAHFFEHLMFKGTKKYPNKEFDRIIQANGGSNNAFTSKDYTGYYENIPSDKLDLILDIESDRMVNLVFDPEEIKNEREVVKEERRMRVEDSVFGALNEAAFETVFKVHPYRWPVIGYMRDLNATSMEHLKDFYRIFYSPNNAVLVIAGDLKINEAKSLVEKHYSDIPSQVLPSRSDIKEPVQKGQRSLRVKKNVQNVTLSVAFQIPEAGTSEQYSADLLSNILGNGPSSRLYKRLVYNEQIADSVSIWSYTPKLAGIFQIFASVKPGGDPERVLNSIYAEIYKMRVNKVSERELNRAKVQMMKDHVDSLKTVAGKANALALNEILFGDYSAMFKDLKKYQSVTDEDILNLAKKYFLPEQRSVVRIEPKSAVN